MVVHSATMHAGGVLTYSQRIRRRQAIWWGGAPWRIGARAHRLWERLRSIDFNKPPENWQCCEFWQRSLSNKLHGHAFAQAHGCRVPDLYWTGFLMGKIPFDLLPDAFVIKPIVGAMTYGVFACAGGVDKMTGMRFEKATLVKSIQKTRGLLPLFPLMIEEFIRPETGAYEVPFDFKFHMFRERIAVIRVTDRTAGRDNARDSFFTPDWELIGEPFLVSMVPLGRIPPPKCLDEMLETARRLGKAYGRYVRVDMYATPRGCVFGEFASTPRRGLGYSHFADEFLGRIWQELLPDDI
jgi:hypothetical protein